MQRLWIVTELFPPDETSTAYILGEIANAMAKKYKVGVITGPEIYDKHKKFDEKNKFILDESIELVRSEIPTLDKNSLLKRLLRFLLVSRKMYAQAKGHIKEDDKVLMVTNPAPLVVLMSRLRKKRQFELMMLVHDVFPENTKPAGLKLPTWAYNFIARIFAKAYSRADLMIALGRDMKEVLAQKVKKFKKEPKITVIENWGDVETIRPQQHEGPNGKIVIEYAGNIGRVQGLGRFIEVLSNLANKDVEFHLWGTGSMENALKQQTVEKGLGNVDFKGTYFRSQQNEVLAACDIALVTLSEGMFGLGVPSKTYNILASGRPVLYIGEKTSEIGLLVAEKGIGNVFEPDDEDGLKSFLENLNETKKEELREMGKKAREVAVNEYSKQAILDKFLKL